MRYSVDRELTLDIAVLSGLRASSEFDRADMKGFYDLRRSIRDPVRLHLRESARPSDSKAERSCYAFSQSQVNDWVGVVAIPESRLLAPARRALWSSLALLGFMMALAATIAARLSRRIAAPLKMLAQRSQTSSASCIDVPESGIKEVDVLKAALMRAAAAQAHSHAQLLDAARRKDEFVSMLGHKLRNPLSGISNASNVLARQVTPDATTAKMHAILRRQTQHLSRLVDDMLDVARVNSGKLSIHSVYFALDELVRRTADQARHTIEHKGLRFKVNAGVCVFINGDPMRMSQVITNLLDNATKYTDAGEIGLTLHTEPGEAVLTVHDTGRGIPADLLPRIFDAFAQHVQSIDRTQGGLAIVKRVVGLHDGTIQAQSTGAGQGRALLSRSGSPVLRAKCKSAGEGIALQCTGEQGVSSNPALTLIC